MNKQIADSTEIRMFFDMHEVPMAYRWRVKGPGGTTLNYSRVCYRTRKACPSDMRAIKARTYQDARIVDLTQYQANPDEELESSGLQY